MEKQPLESLDRKLRSLGFPDPDPGLRQRTLKATADALNPQARRSAAQPRAGWWLDGLLAAAAVLLAIGSSLLQPLGWTPVDPRALHPRESSAHLQQLQEHFDMPLGFAAPAPRVTPTSTTWGSARPSVERISP